MAHACPTTTQARGKDFGGSASKDTSGTQCQGELNAVVGVRSAQEIKNCDWGITAPWLPNVVGNACRKTTETMTQGLNGGAQMVINGLPQGPASDGEVGAQDARTSEGEGR